MLVHVLIIVFTIMQSMHIFSHVIIMDVMILLRNRNMLLRLFEHLCGLYPGHIKLRQHTHIT